MPVRRVFLPLQTIRELNGSVGILGLLPSLFNESLDDVSCLLLAPCQSSSLREKILHDRAHWDRPVPQRADEMDGIDSVAACDA